jgi:dTDP-4-amino-4,6-dideoxygalactose transaminase
MAEINSTLKTNRSRVQPVPFIDLQSQHKAIAPELHQAVQRVFDDQQFILGDEVAELECDVAQYCDSRDAIGCASGTDALILSLMALDIGPGDEVITSPFTFFATASAIHRVGAKPVFVDIEPASFNLDPQRIEEAITEKTRAIMPVHLFGQCAEMEPLWRVAVRERLAIVEDACQAIGGEYRQRRAGVLGTLGCFSFFPTKNLGGAGDGGLVTTDDPALAARLRLLRIHGDGGDYQHVEVGINSRLDALQAAVLRAKLAHLEEWTEARQQNALRYDELFRHHELLDAVELPTVLPDRRHVFNQYTIRLKGKRRDQVLGSLRKQQIGAAVYYPVPLHLQPCFADLGYAEGDFSESEAAAAQVLALPIFPELQPEQQETVVAGIARALDRQRTSTLSPSAGALKSPKQPQKPAA